MQSTEFVRVLTFNKSSVLIAKLPPIKNHWHVKANKNDKNDNSYEARLGNTESSVPSHLFESGYAIVSAPDALSSATSTSFRNPATYCNDKVTLVNKRMIEKAIPESIEHTGLTTVTSSPSQRVICIPHIFEPSDDLKDELFQNIPHATRVGNERSYERWLYQNNKNTQTKEVTIIMNPSRQYTIDGVDEDAVITINLLENSNMRAETNNNQQQLWSNMCTTVQLERGSILYLDSRLFFDVNVKVEKQNRTPWIAMVATINCYSPNNSKAQSEGKDKLDTTTAFFDDMIVQQKQQKVK